MTKSLIMLFKTSFKVLLVISIHLFLRIDFRFYDFYVVPLISIIQNLLSLYILNYPLINFPVLNLYKLSLKYENILILIIYKQYKILFNPQQIIYFVINNKINPHLFLK